ncbi:MAG: hypothetical protein KW788_05215 [Candidatus Doudnabacteria bacterium]|nr:hypothetical protein [Candidatus Doudnabacteria bacterium]
MDWKFGVPLVVLVYMAGHIMAHGYLGLTQIQLLHPALIVPLTILMFAAVTFIAGTFEAWQENKPDSGRALIELCVIVFGPILFTYIATYVHDLGIQQWAAWLKFRVSGAVLLLIVAEVLWDYLKHRAGKKKQQTVDATA